MSTHTGVTNGARVLVFDHRLFKDDRSTPLSVTMKSATVIRRYDYQGEFGHYDVVDVEFDYRPRKVSKAHLVEGIKS